MPARTFLDNAMREGASIALKQHGRSSSLSNLNEHPNDDNLVEQVKKLYKDHGVRLFVGPSSTDQWVPLREWAKREAGDAVFVSPFVSTDDGDEGNCFFSMSMENRQTARVFLARWRKMPIRKVLAVVNRGCTYGRDFYQALLEENSILKLPYEIKPVLYNVEHGGILEEDAASQIVRQVHDRVSQWNTSSNMVAILMVGDTSDAAKILTAVEREQKSLLRNRWFGTDSLALDPEFDKHEGVAHALQRSMLTVATFAGENTLPSYRNLPNVGEKTDRLPLIQELLAYDATKLLLETTIKLATKDPRTICRHMRSKSFRWRGASGLVQFTKSGFRSRGSYMTAFFKRSEIISPTVDISSPSPWMLEHEFEVNPDEVSVVAADKPTLDGVNIIKKKDIEMVIKILGWVPCLRSEYVLNFHDSISGERLTHIMPVSEMKEYTLVPAVYGWNAKISCVSRNKTSVLQVSCSPSWDGDSRKCLASFPAQSSSSGRSTSMPRRRRLLQINWFDQTVGCTVVTGSCGVVTSTLLAYPEEWFGGAVADTGCGTGNAVCGGLDVAGAAVSIDSAIKSKIPIVTNRRKIICTELFEQGIMPIDQYLSDMVFGERMAENHPHVLQGYWLWAKPVVRLMQQSRTATWIVQQFARPWSEEMAYMIGHSPEGSLFGKILMQIGWYLSTIVYYLGELTTA